jgi:hypothetical protein
MTPLRFLLAALVLGCAVFAGATPARAGTLQAVLLTASPEKGPTDPRLANFEATLKRVLRFNSFTFQGSDSADLKESSRAEMIIGQGHELVVETGANPYAVRIRWTENGKVMMNTGITLRAGIPAVLGGPSTGRAAGEVYAVILVMR